MKLPEPIGSGSENGINTTLYCHKGSMYIIGNIGQNIEGGSAKPVTPALFVSI